MTKDHSDKTKQTRRSMLKSGVTGVGALALGPAVTQARRGTGNSLRDKIQRAQAIRERTGSQEKFHRYLRNHGIDWDIDEATFAVPTGNSSDGVSVQYNENSLAISIGLYYDCAESGYEDIYYCEQGFLFSPSSSWEAGEMPYDVMGMGYDQSWWDLAYYSISETTETSTYVQTNSSDGFDGTGPVYDVDDASIYWDGAEGDHHYGGVYLKPVGNATEDERRLQGSYVHTWNSVSIDSVSVGFPLGVSVSASNDTNTWRTKTEIDGDTLLRVNQADARGRNCGP